MSFDKMERAQKRLREAGERSVGEVHKAEEVPHKLKAKKKTYYAKR